MWHVKGHSVHLQFIFRKLGQLFLIQFLFVIVFQVKFFVYKDICWNFEIKNLTRFISKAFKFNVGQKDREKLL